MISSSTVVTSVVEKLRQALARGQWRSGDMLPGPRELAEQLGISRPSLREADAALPEPGLDTSASASLADVLELRYTLEPFIVGLVAQSANSHDIGQLRLTLMDMREALDADDSEAGVKAYIALHEALFSLTTNPIFQSVVQQTSNALKQSADMLRNSPEHLAARLKESNAVVRAIRERNSAEASAQMRQHILAEGQRMGIQLNIPDEHPRP